MTFTSGIHPSASMLRDRMHSNGIELSFDKENTVWHNDDSYMEFNDQTLKKEVVNQHFGMDMAGDESFVHPEFEKELGLCLQKA